MAENQLISNPITLPSSYIWSRPFLLRLLVTSPNANVIRPWETFLQAHVTKSEVPREEDRSWRFEPKWRVVEALNSLELVSRDLRNKLRLISSNISSMRRAPSVGEPREKNWHHSHHKAHYALQRTRNRCSWRRDFIRIFGVVGFSHRMIT